MNKFYLFLLAFLLTLSSCSSKRGKTYYKADYGDKWPFTVDEVRVYCANGISVFLEANEEIYYVNGASKSSGIPAKDIIEIQKDNPDIPGTKIGYIDGMINEALEECEEK